MVNIDKGTEYTVKLNQQLDETFQITTTMPEENTEIPIIDNTPKTVTGIIDAIGDAEIIFIHKKEIAPITGIDENLNPILFFSIIFVVLYVVNYILKRKIKQS